jgi:hypothetical protein
VQMAAIMIGGGLAAGTHAAKAGTRALINTSPEPVTNWTASVGEDLMVVAGLWTALNHPAVFLLLLAAFVLLLIWLLPRLWRTLRAVFARVRAFFGGEEAGGLPPAAHKEPLALEERHR